MPIAFSCPHCQTSMHVDDQYAGTSGPCRSCGQQITIPGTATGATFQEPKQTSGAAVIIAVLAAVVLGGVAVVGILVALLLPAVQAAREAARRTQCVNNQRQIALALLNYESANGTLPPAYSVDENGQPMLSWRVLILPYLGEHPLYSQFNLDEPWDSAQNSTAAQSMPGCFGCPSSPLMPSQTNYVVVIDAESAFPGAEGIKLQDIQDGTSRTVGVVEITGPGVLWSKPLDIALAELDQVGSDHPGVFNASMLDGSVQTLDEISESAVLVNDGE